MSNDINVALLVAMAVGGVQVIQTLGMPLAGWYLRKQVGRIDDHERRTSTLEAISKVHEVRLENAPNTEDIRLIIREELDRAFKGLDDRLTRLENQGQSK